AQHGARERAKPRMRGGERKKIRIVASYPNGKFGAAIVFIEKIAFRNPCFSKRRLIQERKNFRQLLLTRRELAEIRIVDESDRATLFREAAIGIVFSQVQTMLRPRSKHAIRL